MTEEYKKFKPANEESRGGVLEIFKGDNLIAVREPLPNGTFTRFFCEDRIIINVTRGILPDRSGNGSKSDRGKQSAA